MANPRPIAGRINFRLLIVFFNGESSHLDDEGIIGVGPKNCRTCGLEKPQPQLRIIL